ncbi:MAG TPA: hypothetical protein VD962_03815 [Rubricoccaceae bacterium]|nr:hypothetical protein [Rubricoccaceae bacterium]
MRPPLRPFEGARRLSGHPVPHPFAARLWRTAGAIVFIGGLLSGCDSDSPTSEAGIIMDPTGAIEMEVGDALSVEATRYNSSNNVSFSSSNPAVASVLPSGSSGDRFNAVIQAHAVGTATITGFVSTLATATLDVTVVAAPSGQLPTGVHTLPLTEPEALLLLNAAGGGFAGLTGTYLAAFAGTPGFAVLDLLTNQVLHQPAGLTGGPFFGVAAASHGTRGPTDPAAFVAFGLNGFVLQNYHTGAFKPPVQHPNRTYDAFPAGGTVATDVISFVQPGLGAGFIPFNGSIYAPTSEMLDIPDTEGEMVSAYLYDDAPGARVLILARAVDSGLFLGQRGGGAPTRVLSLGLDGRKIRCTPSSAGGVLCGVTMFGNDRVALVRWDGMAAPTLAGFASAGDGPVDLDLHALPGGNIALVTSGFNNHLISEVELTPGGGVVSNMTRAAPAGCVNPGHVIYVRDTAGLKVVGTCYGSDNYFIDPSRFSR